MTAFSQRSFSGGEIAPSLFARVDMAKYATGLRTCRNFAVARHGGVFNRPGTGFLSEIKDSTKTVRLIPFVFNSDQTYVIEMGNLYARFYRSGAQIVETEKNITGATQANPCVVTINAHGYSNGEEVFISGVGGMTQINNRNFKVAGVTANTFQLNYMDGSQVDSTGFSAYTSGGTAARVYTITTPYAEADLQDLQFVQSADVLTIVHPSYAPRNLSRTGHTSWSISAISFVPWSEGPTGLTNTGAAGSTTQWTVTAVREVTFEESSTQDTTSSSATPTSGSPITVSWSAVTGAQSYNIYKLSNGIYGFIGTAGGTSFVDNGIPADTTQTPPELNNLFLSSGDWPSAIGYHQQRLILANSDNSPETTWASKTGSFYNFTSSFPIQDDDAVTFTIAGRQVNEVRHVLDINGKMVILTTGGEWSVEGDQSGILTPTGVNARQHSYNGASPIPPLVVGGNALYIQARGSIVRDLAFDYQVDGYRGNDLTVFSSHLFDLYSLRDWTWQQIPHSIVWVVRSDGTLLGLTYVREHEVWAWHHHDFDGTVEQVCAIPEGNEDALYLVIKRTINGATKRYVERLKTRQIDDIVDSVFVDCSLSYDGRNTDTGHTMTLSGGTEWEFDETLTLTSSASYFSASEIGNAIHLTGSDGTVIRLTITGYTSATIVSGTPSATVPFSMRNVAISNWARAVDQLSGLWHLEGKEVSIQGDGYVVASPNNASYDAVTVQSGVVTLDRPYAVIHVGLPVTADIETLDIDTVNGETMADKKKLITKVALFVESTRGLWVGPKPPDDDTVDPLESLSELQQSDETDVDTPVSLETGVLEVNIQPEWNSNGRVFVRQVDPVPATILSIVPVGLLPLRG